MNSAAPATGPHLRVNHHRFILTDDGHGRTEPETVRWWSAEVLCQPDGTGTDTTAVAVAVRKLRELGCARRSKINYQAHAWYTSEPTFVDEIVGEYEEVTAHPYGFSPADLRRIWDRLDRPHT